MRDAKTAATGGEGGKPPSLPVEGPSPTDQVNLTDEESRIMPGAGGGFEQAYNAQAMVAAGSLLVVAIDVVQAPNGKQQLQPMLGKFSALPEELVDRIRQIEPCFPPSAPGLPAFQSDFQPDSSESFSPLGKAETLLADTGYFSEANVQAWVAARESIRCSQWVCKAHHPSLAERFPPRRRRWSIRIGWPFDRPPELPSRARTSSLASSCRDFARPCSAARFPPPEQMG